MKFLRRLTSKFDVLDCIVFIVGALVAFMFLSMFLWTREMHQDWVARGNAFKCEKQVRAELSEIKSVALSFEEVDTNHDERISVAEVRMDKRVAVSFASTDVNQDGYLDRKESEVIWRDE